jgi:hypothetical protein
MSDLKALRTELVQKLVRSMSTKWATAPHWEQEFEAALVQYGEAIISEFERRVKELI